MSSCSSSVGKSLRPVRLLHRLGREPEVLADVSDGGRVRCGTSARSSFQARSSRHISGGSQAKPPSISTIFSVGNRSKTPSQTRLVTWSWNAVAMPTWSSM